MDSRPNLPSFSFSTVDNNTYDLIPPSQSCNPSVPSQTCRSISPPTFSLLDDDDFEDDLYPTQHTLASYEGRPNSENPASSDDGGDENSSDHDEHNQDMEHHLYLSLDAYRMPDFHEICATLQTNVDVFKDEGEEDTYILH